MTVTAYREFLEAKVAAAPSYGFVVDPREVHPSLKPHQRDSVVWALAGGRRALFHAFGLGKTRMGLECVRLATASATRKLGLIVAPLGVRREFLREAAELDTPLTFVRSSEEVGAPGLYLTNYESVREGKLDPTLFDVVHLDEASILRGFGGTKTFREFMTHIAGDDGGTGQGGKGVAYRFVATATPAPNEYEELLAYGAYLGVMQISEAKTRFFKRDATKADNLTLHPHKRREFWTWLASWALFVQTPSDLGYSDEGYQLPPVTVRWHEVGVDHRTAGEEMDGQGKMFRSTAIGLADAAKEKRDSLPARLAKLAELRAAEPGEHRIIWHDLESERRHLERLGVECVYGARDLDEREEVVADFCDGRIAELGAKPVMLGSGTNMQRHCARAVYLGIGFKFNDFIQSFHRVVRFLQTRAVVVDIIYSEAERDIRKVLERKWTEHNELVAEMTAIIREYGLAQISMASALERKMDVTRREASGTGWKLVNGDAIEEIKAVESDSVHLVVSSIPFSTQYEYTPSYRDLGHTDDDEHFFEHLGYLTPELLRVLQPGRVAAIHVKDRITPGGINGFGFQTVSPFSDHTVTHFRRHGFAFLARITIVTDVVRENNQTYRLGWTEQCKDGSKQGNGLPEYVLLFRKPPSDRSNGYADVPVVKAKDDYALARWQVDASGYQRSNGNRHLAPEEIADLPHAQVYRLWKQYALDRVYDYEQHVALGEALKDRKRLPTTFTVIPAPSWHPHVWADVVRMRTLNTMQAVKGAQQHLCPMPLDIVKRLITRLSMPGELVLDPFAGLASVLYEALQLDRQGLGFELNPQYWTDGVGYCKAAESKVAVPTLFDLAGEES